MEKNRENNERKSFTFYASFEEAINDIEESDKDTKLNLYRAICRYALYREEPKIKGVAKVMWRIIKPTLDTQWTKYNNGCKGAEFGVNGGAPSGNKNASKTTPKQPLNNPYSLYRDKDIDIDKDIEGDKGKDEEPPYRGVNNTPTEQDFNVWLNTTTGINPDALPIETKRELWSVFLRWLTAKQNNMFVVMRDIETEMKDKYKPDLCAYGAIQEIANKPEVPTELLPY